MKYLTGKLTGLFSFAVGTTRLASNTQYLPAQFAFVNPGISFLIIEDETF